MLPIPDKPSVMALFVLNVVVVSSAEPWQSSAFTLVSHQARSRIIVVALVVPAWAHLRAISIAP